MKIFLSWSRGLGKSRANLLQNVLDTFGGIDLIFSERDMTSGKKWREDLHQHLRDAEACVICLTGDALNSSWIQYEVGAIAGQGKPVFPLLVDIVHPSSGPLEQFQGDDWSHSGLKKFITTLNGRLPAPQQKTPEQLNEWLGIHWRELRQPDKDVLGELLRLKNSADVPFMLAMAARLWSQPQPEHKKRAAIWELLDAVQALRPEQLYLPDVIELIKDGSVDAICGRKAEQIADQFNEANRQSGLRGHRITRIFFPPEAFGEAEAIRRAISVHLETENMTAQTFGKAYTSSSAKTPWHLPIGFGMTIIQADEYTSQSAKRALPAVLVHWGSVEQSEAHRGIILRDPLWITECRTLFDSVKTVTQPVTARTWAEFLAAGNEHYDPKNFRSNR